MLIPSERHTKQDLELWAEYEEADVSHYRIAKVSEKVDRAVAVIQQFASDGSCYGSVSWGKDSVVLSHLICLSGVQVPLVHLRGVPTGNPDCLRVRDVFLTTHKVEYREIEVRYKAVDLTGCEEMQRDGDKLWMDTIRSQCKRYISGIRADESAGRRIRFRRLGLSSINTCAPLGWWTASDVFACLAVHKLPAHPAYAMLGGGRWKRSNLRTDELLGARGNQFGRAEWEQEYYGDVLRRLAAK
jgi:phosphoadenosine phosphosulfate reductase